MSAGQNGARLFKMAKEEIGSSLVLKLYCVMLNRILARYLQKFFFSLHFSHARKNPCYQGTHSPKAIAISDRNVKIYTQFLTSSKTIPFICYFILLPDFVQSIKTKGHAQIPHKVLPTAPTHCKTRNPPHNYTLQGS